MKKILRVQFLFEEEEGAKSTMTLDGDDAETWRRWVIGACKVLHRLGQNPRWKGLNWIEEKQQ